MKKVILGAMIFILCFIKVSFAEDIRVRNYKFEKEVSINGVIGSSSKFFNIEKTWDVGDVTLNLNFNKSQIINGDVSSLSILINDIPIKSIKLDGKKDYKETLKVQIPKNYLIEGYNEIKIKIYKTISDKICQDDNNTGNWIVLNKESYISVRYKNKNSSNLIKEYPYPYINLNEDETLDTTIIVPDNIDRGELSALFNISSNFGNLVKDESLKFNVKLYSESKNEKNNIIYIGKPENTKEEILKFLTNEERKLASSNCIVKQIISPYNNQKKMLMIIGSKDEDIIKASNLLTNKELSKQILSESVTVNKDTNVETIVNKKNNTHLKLKDIGYSNVLLEGPFTQEAIFDIKIPDGKIIEDDAKIVINLRYAKNLDFERSLATVYVNNSPIGSQKLEKQLADGHIIELKMPKDVLHGDYYQVKISLNLIVKDVACVTRATNSPWGYILNSSYLNLPMKDTISNKLQYYPYPFIKDKSYNDLTIVVQDKINSRDIKWISNIAIDMGKRVEENNGRINIVKSNDFDQKYKNDNLIVLGTPLSSNLIKDMNNSFNIKLNEDYSSFVPNDKINLLDNYAKDISTIQLIQSPYNKDKRVLVVSAINQVDLQVGMNYLTDISKIKDTKGDTIVIDRYNTVKELTYSNEVIEQNDNKKILSKSTKSFIIFGVSASIAVIILSSLFIIKYKRK